MCHNSNAPFSFILPVSENAYKIKNKKAIAYLLLLKELFD